MKENKKKKFHIRWPKLTPLNLILMILIPIVLFFVIAIPVLYVNEYNANKVTPFASDISNIDSKQIIYGNKNTITDFNFKLYCSSYNNETGAITFRTIAYENENTNDKIKLSNQITIKVGMYSNWIKTDASASSRSRYIAPGPKVALGSSRYYAEFSISGIPPLPKKGGLPFIKVKNIPAYAYVTYKTTINGTETTKYYILKYEYKDYIIGAQELIDTRDKEVQVNNNNIQWRYQKDTSWTTLVSTSNYTGIETRITETHIQWKRKCDSNWTNLREISSLSGYSEDKQVEVRESGSYLQWKFTDETNWKNIVSTSTLQQPEIRINGDMLQWKRQGQTEWKDLKAIKDLDNYGEEKSLNTIISDSYVQWKWNEETDYHKLVSVESLVGFQVRINPDTKNLEWKCADDEEWKPLEYNGDILNEKTLDVTPAVIGPTVGGI